MFEKPTEGQLAALRALEKNEHGDETWINTADAEQCCFRGWTRAVPGEQIAYRLTDEGRAILKSYS